MNKMPISLFVERLKEALNRKDGYIMGATGQNPRNWAENSWWFTQYGGSQKEKALYWREHAQRVWDCNGMAEGLYKDYAGVDINTKARYNYSGWCDPNGTGLIPTNKRVPGAAVFIHSASSGYITHVGYLVEPVDDGKPYGDWYVIEARGVMYGVVKTKLSQRGWNRWGWMTKYFDYENQIVQPTTKHLGNRILRNGDEGDDVREMQNGLIQLGYTCGHYGADGEFGDATELAVRKFQQNNKLTVDGEFGPKSLAMMEKMLAAVSKPVSEPKRVQIVGGQCWARTEPNTSATKIGVAKSGSTYNYLGISEDGWLQIEFNGAKAWISGKYGRLIE